LLALLMCAITAIFLLGKLATPAFDQAQYFRDTASYASMADVPVTSAYFWAGERPFTLPLFFKLIGVSSQNYQTPGVMAVVAGWQIGLSIFCWALLGLVLAWSLRSHWIGGLAYGFILIFSLSYEIGKWDVLLLSESISFSLFALLLAAWILLLSLLSRLTRGVARFACLASTILVTVLYTFVRDSNIYYVVIGAAMFAGAALLYKRWKPIRGYLLAYLACALILLAAQNASISLGNRWQIFIYDQMAYRIIPNKQALAYFVRAGLPVNDQLLKIPKMRGAVYQDLMLHSPEMETVRQWTNAHGKATYFGYLLSQPFSTIIEPVQEASTLLNGTGMDYRVPSSPGLSVPRVLRGVTRLFFPRAPVWVYAAIWLVLLGACTVGFIYDQQAAAWLTAAVLLISMVPLMFLVWHANPMEIPRHADQIAIQFRLAGWMILALCLDWSLQRASNRRNSYSQAAANLIGRLIQVNLK
jgi:hypothetical protein